MKYKKIEIYYEEGEYQNCAHSNVTFNFIFYLYILCFSILKTTDKISREMKPW